MAEVTVVGGGLAGLVAAIECAEQKTPVRVVEARSRLGGRATSTAEPFVANHGPHAFYTGPFWDWLADRDLHRPFRVPKSPAITFRWNGEVRRTPPMALLRGLRHLYREPPVDASLSDWLALRTDSEATRAVANFAGPLTFDHDPGRLAAAFVAPRLRRILVRVPTPARYVVGGWNQVVERAAARARRLGVVIETNVKVDDIEALGAGPIIVATAPRSARALLGDDTLRVESPEVLCYDVGLEARRGDPYLVFDLDEAGFVDRFTAVDRSLAPSGHSLIQAMIGIRPGEDRASATSRMESLLDAALSDWRARTVWDRRAVLRESTGAIDLPGRTWRDRPSIAHRPGLWLAGDWVAVDGHLAEVSHSSAIAAARAAARGSARATTHAHGVADVSWPSPPGDGTLRAGKRGMSCRSR